MRQESVWYWRVTSAVQREGVLCHEREYALPAGSHLQGESVQYQKGHTSSMRRQCAASRESVQYPRVTSAVREEGHQCKEREHAVPGGSYLHYEDRLFGIKRKCAV